jgi:xanthine dioxygenase
MVWRNPLNPDRPFLQVHGCCIFKLTTRNPKTESLSVIDDVAEVRKIVHGFQKRIWAAENIYAHRWNEGDLVIFHNRGVMHSITGQLSAHKESEDKKRLLWQCTMTSGTPPKAFRAYPGVNESGFVIVS